MHIIDIEELQLLLPLGVIGIWRWSVWFIVKILGVFKYKPSVEKYETSVSLVVPVYNEDPALFKKALESWKTSNPTEIIAVIDSTDTDCIKVFKSFKRKYSCAKLIITETPGKRPALADGIREAKGEVVALVDSDTLWEKDTLIEGLKPFSDPAVGGVATRQNVVDPSALSQKVFDTQLDSKYADYYKFFTATGPYLRCLSGRTAFYRRDAVIDKLYDLVNETFLGVKVISGDDKRLTYLVQRAGWKTYYQATSRVYTPGEKNLRVFISQKVRWTRNAWREDIKAFFEKWETPPSPLFMYGFVDSAIQPFTLLISPMFFITFVLSGKYMLAFYLAFWWLISRAVKHYSHFRRRPEDLLILPVYIPLTFYFGLIKVYALFTLNTQGWITRWDESRLSRVNFLKRYLYYGFTSAVIFVLFGLVYFYTSNFYRYLEGNVLAQSSHRLVEKNFDTSDEEFAAPGIDYVSAFDRHVVQPGESIIGISELYGVDPNGILAINNAFIANWNNIEIGMILTIPLDNRVKFSSESIERKEIEHFPLQEIAVEPDTGEIVVTGRGNIVNLSEIHSVVGDEYLEEILPKVWLLKKTLRLKTGVQLALTSDEVEWLKLESNKDYRANILSTHAQILIDGVLITSWDSAQNTFDLDVLDGRSYILAKSEGRMDIYNSELAYLGYLRGENESGGTYGVSWRVPPEYFEQLVLTGEVKNSTFHDNYFGAYTFGAMGMLWEKNDFYKNKQYGLDPHDDSSYFIVQNNNFYDNGNHGLIFSKRCNWNYISNNTSWNNELHGIMLHENSINNLVENNVVYRNKDGIAIYMSSNNTVRSNDIYDNRTGIRVNEGASANLIIDNRISGNSKYGIYFYDYSDRNNVAFNNFVKNKVGSYIKDSSTNQVYKNLFSRNREGVIIIGTSAENIFTDNEFVGNRNGDVLSKTQRTFENYWNSHLE